MEIRVSGLSDVGRMRDHNEDSFLVDGDLRLFAVADGMGGHAAGEVASAAALQVMKNELSGKRQVFEKFARETSDENTRAVLMATMEAAQKASAAVFKLAEQESGKKGMGTTLSMLVLADRHGIIAHVGDSRIYLLRRGEVHQLTEDHTLVAEQLKAGLISPEEAAYAPYSNIITRAVGVQEFVQADVTHFEVLPGDRFLMCSDGLAGYLKQGDIEKIIFSGSEEDAAKAFIEYANLRGGKDNITAVVVHLIGEEPEAAEELFLKIDTLKAIPLFRNLVYRELVEILNISKVRLYKAGDMVVEEGSEGEELFIILKGIAEVEKAGVAMARLTNGMHFGEMALIDRSPRSATIKALEDLRVMTIHRNYFYNLIRREHALSIKLLWGLLRELSLRLRETDKHFSFAISKLSHGDDI